MSFLKRYFCGNVRHSSKLATEEEHLMAAHQNEVTWTTSDKDNVWSCLVGLGLFFMNFVILGIARMNSIMFEEYMDMFHVQRKTASAPYSLQQSVARLFGPVTGILGQRFGISTVTVAGSLVAAVSSAACYFAEDMTVIIVLFGGVYGFGTALIGPVKMILIEQYFAKYRSSASGFVYSGTSIGGVFFPAVLSMVSEKYGIHGMFLLVGSLVLFVVPVAMVLKEKTKSTAEESFGTRRSLSTTDNLFETDPKSSFRSHTEDNGKFIPIFSSFSDTVSPDNLSIKGDLQISVSLTSNEKNVNDRTSAGTVYRSSSVENLTSINPIKDMDPRQNIKADHESFKKYTKEDAKTVSVKIMESNSCVNSKVKVPTTAKPRETVDSSSITLATEDYFDASSKPSSSDTIHSEKDIILNKDFECCSEQEKKYKLKKPPCPLGCPYSSKSFSESSKSSADGKQNEVYQATFKNQIVTALKVHANPMFLLVCVSRGLFALTFLPVIACVVDFTTDKGMAKSDGIYAIGALSAGDLIGRLCTGWITDKDFVSDRNYMVLALMLLGVSTATLPMMSGMVMLLPALVMFTLLEASLFLKHPVILMKYLRKHEQYLGLGFMPFFPGILGLLVPYYIGYFRDYLGSYDMLLYINGGLSFLVGCLWILEPFLLKFVPAIRGAELAS